MQSTAVGPGPRLSQENGLKLEWAVMPGVLSGRLTTHAPFAGEEHCQVVGLCFG